MFGKKAAAPSFIQRSILARVKRRVLRYAPLLRTTHKPRYARRKWAAAGEDGADGGACASTRAYSPARAP